MSQHEVLIRWPGEHVTPADARAWVSGTLGQTACRVLHGVDTELTYVRVPLAAAPSAQQHADWEAAARRRNPAAEVAVLRLTLERAGASAGQSYAWHYVVETDVLPEAEADFNAWYNEEHLPGLASVPGTVRATRHLIDQGAPRYYAGYDLHTRETFGSPPWLAVRATAWSDRVRPNFRQTRRTMLRDAQ